MNAGFRGNVIPGSAEATINVRTIPGTDPNDLVREFQGWFEDVGGEPLRVRLVVRASSATP